MDSELRPRGFTLMPNHLIWASDLSGNELLLLLALMSRAFKDGVCYSSRNRLYKEARLTKHTFDRTVASLIARGFIEKRRRVSSKTGAEVSAAYRVKVENFLFEEPPKHGRPENGTPLSRKRDAPYPESGTHPTPESGDKEEYINKNTLIKVSPYMSPTEKREELEQQFQQFWNIYPRHENQRRAFTSFRNALARGTPLETILTGAQRYADDPNRVPQYTKHPATWLDNDCWTDDPLPARHQPPTGDIMAEIIDDLTRGPYNANFGNSHLLPSTPTWQWETDQPIP